MMKIAPIDTLLEKVDSKYTLVTLTAKIARRITEDREKNIELRPGKAVSIALKDIGEDKVSYTR